MRTKDLPGRPGASRRQSLAAAVTFAGGTAQDSPATASTIKAVAFDAFAIFDPRAVFRLTEELFPGRGEELSNQWRKRRFGYTWLRNSMRLYADCWHVRQDDLSYAAQQSKRELTAEKSSPPGVTADETHRDLASLPKFSRRPADVATYNATSPEAAQFQPVIARRRYISMKPSRYGYSGMALEA